MIRYSNKELELIAENELNKCEEDYFIRDGVINIELFIEKHFKLELEYKKLVTDQIAILFVTDLVLVFCQKMMMILMKK